MNAYERLFGNYEFCPNCEANLTKQKDYSTHALRHEQLYSNKGKRVMIPFAPPENESDGDTESAYIEENAGFDEAVAAESEAS